MTYLSKISVYFYSVLVYEAAVFLYLKICVVQMKSILFTKLVRTLRSRHIEEMVAKANRILGLVKRTCKDTDE